MDKDMTPPSAGTGSRPARTAWLFGGVLAVASLAAGAGMLMRSAMPTPGAATELPPATAALAAEVPPPPAGRPVQAAPQRRAAAPAATCRDCGTVESVRTVTRKGEGSGIGAVAGGVLGAAVGNQMGKGNGRSAMTVLGAVGGGMAGHEVEKRSKSVTVHRVSVRMDDGTLRTVEVARAPRAGERVIVEGSRLKPAARVG